MYEVIKPNGEEITWTTTNDVYVYFKKGGGSFWSGPSHTFGGDFGSSGNWSIKYNGKEYYHLPDYDISFDLLQ